MSEPLGGPGASAPGSGQLPTTWLEVATDTLLGDASFDWCVEVMGPGWLALHSGQHQVVLIEYAPERPREWTEHFDRVLRRAGGKLHVALLGGPRELRRELLARSELARIYLHHVDASGDVWQQRRPAWSSRRLVRSLQRGLGASATRPFWQAADAVAHARRLARDLARSRRELGQQQRLRRSLDQRSAWASLTLSLILLCVFGLQWWWGGVDLPPLLARMGSLVPERAWAGEWWRFFSCTFLHGGTWHVVLNAFVLWMLGRFLERFVGSTRFLLIYFTSGLAGSVSSACFVTSQSVGASGAIWGLLGAEVALAFYPKPLLPAAMIPMARRTVLANLGLNLLASFSPHVDLAAHVGGGLMGALVFCWLAARARVPLGEGLAARTTPATRRVTALLAATFALGLLVGQWQGRPWQLAASPSLVRVPLGALHWSVELPADLSPSQELQSPTSRSFGNLAYDPCVVDITWAALPRATEPLDVPHELSMIQRQLTLPQAGLQPLEAPSVRSDVNGSWVGARYRYVSNEAVSDDRAIGIIDDLLVRVDVVGWEALPQTAVGLATRILHSLERGAWARTAAGLPSRPSVLHFDPTPSVRSPLRLDDARPGVASSMSRVRAALPFTRCSRRALYGASGLRCRSVSQVVVFAPARTAQDS
jgi:membrane associated rhomboid family serine protease